MIWYAEDFQQIHGQQAMRRAAELPVRMRQSSALSQRQRLKRNWVTKDKTLNATPQLQGWSVAFPRMRTA